MAGGGVSRGALAYGAEGEQAEAARRRFCGAPVFKANAVERHLTPSPRRTSSPASPIRSDIFRAASTSALVTSTISYEL